jgi:hypothetical protein
LDSFSDAGAQRLAAELQWQAQVSRAQKEYRRSNRTPEGRASNRHPPDQPAYIVDELEIFIIFVRLFGRELARNDVCLATRRSLVYQKVIVSLYSAFAEAKGVSTHRGHLRLAVPVDEMHDSAFASCSIRSIT